MVVYPDRVVPVFIVICCCPLVRFIISISVSVLPSKLILFVDKFSVSAVPSPMIVVKLSNFAASIVTETPAVEPPLRSKVSVVAISVSLTGKVSVLISVEWTSSISVPAPPESSIPSLMSVAAFMSIVSLWSAPLEWSR